MSTMGGGWEGPAVASMRSGWEEAGVVVEGAMVGDFVASSIGGEMILNCYATFRGRCRERESYL